MATTTPTFVLLHGLLCDGQTWSHLAGPLSRLGPVSIPRLSGLSSLPAAAAEVLERTSGPLIVIGHSMGGRIALEIARQAPDRCAGLVLMNTGYEGLGEGETTRRMAQVEAARAGGVGAIVDAWLDGMIAPRTRDDAALMRSMRDMVLRSTPDSFAGQIQALIERPDATALLGRIACPTLLMSGEEDRWSPLDRHHEMASHIPGSEVAAIAAAGHMAPFEEPEACTRAILEWLGRRGLASTATL
ncbi:alpha/beta hydrolase [Castellaniella sp. GW247-6E4]|uniref:alpha/beta fold hydrolase n=1 Tax=Castellaniella sp. GW247-6E4 TaxID=3140380 RepID=UPI003315A19C